MFHMWNNFWFLDFYLSCDVINLTVHDSYNLPLQKQLLIFHMWNVSCLNFTCDMKINMLLLHMWHVKHSKLPCVTDFANVILSATRGIYKFHKWNSRRCKWIWNISHVINVKTYVVDFWTFETLRDTFFSFRRLKRDTFLLYVIVINVTCGKAHASQTAQIWSFKDKWSWNSFFLTLD